LKQKKKKLNTPKLVVMCGAQRNPIRGMEHGQDIRTVDVHVFDVQAALVHKYSGGALPVWTSPFSGVHRLSKLRKDRSIAG
jgi:hypothetical protein